MVSLNSGQRGKKSQNLEAKDLDDAVACQHGSARYRDGGGGAERGLVVARVIGIRTLAAFPGQLSPAAAHTAAQGAYLLLEPN